MRTLKIKQQTGGKKEKCHTRTHATHAHIHHKNAKSKAIIDKQKVENAQTKHYEKKKKPLQKSH